MEGPVLPPLFRRMFRRIQNNAGQDDGIAQKSRDGHEAALAEAHANVGNINRDLGDLKEAVDHYEKAEMIYRQTSAEGATEVSPTRKGWVTGI
jgi:tetratricopeptide (TPR) repeat protein